MVLEPISRILCKPCGGDRHFSRPLARPSRRSGMRHTRGCWTGRPAAYFALHRIGFFVPSASRRNAVGSYPTFSPLPGGCPPGGVFSVTLSVATGYGPWRPGLSRSVSMRWSCDRPTRRDNVSCRESCPVVSGLSSRSCNGRGVTRALGSKN